MKLITRETDYAVRALSYIVRNKGKLFSAADLVKELNIPQPFMRKILQRLKKHGILLSYKGKGGGFDLALHPEKIYLSDVIRIFQGPIKFSDCILKKKLCPDTANCFLRSELNAIERFAQDRLESITIS